MSKIKICGIFRMEDAAYINESRPDYFGMVIGFEQSHRNVAVQTAAQLRKQINSNIPAAGVFVDADPERILMLLEAGIIDIAQLHGNETEEEIRMLRKKSRKPVWKAFRIRSETDLEAALRSPADLILLDSGYGSGRTFDWDLLGEIKRPFALAGGLHAGNLAQAISRFHPELCDLSSGVETDRRKDPVKIRQAVEIVRAAL